MLQKIEFEIAPDHPAFAGHFPGNPIVPGVVLLDLALLALGAALQRNLDASRINNAKFLSVVRPGEQLHLQVDLEAMLAGRALGFEIFCDARKVAAVSVGID